MTAPILICANHSRVLALFANTSLDNLEVALYKEDGDGKEKVKVSLSE